MPSFRGLVTTIALLAFFFQSFAIQTHIHHSEPGALVASAGTITVKATSLDRDHHAPSPADDPDHCPLCQEFLHAGSFVTPVPVTLSLPVSVAIVAPPVSVP
ncbi:MAG: hypothetical protein ACREGR_01255, partial [Minisyncoccia bacterium]